MSRGEVRLQALLGWVTASMQLGSALLPDLMWQSCWREGIALPWAAARACPSLLGFLPGTSRLAWQAAPGGMHKRAKPSAPASALPELQTGVVVGGRAGGLHTAKRLRQSSVEEEGASARAPSWGHEWQTQRPTKNTWATGWGLNRHTRRLTRGAHQLLPLTRRSLRSSPGRDGKQLGSMTACLDSHAWPLVGQGKQP